MTERERIIAQVAGTLSWGNTVISQAEDEATRHAETVGEAVRLARAIVAEVERTGLAQPERS